MRTLLLLTLTSFLAVSGCQTKATSERFSMAQQNALICQQRVLHYKEKVASAPRTQFKDERNALVYLVVQELAKSKAGDELGKCDDLYIAMVQADAQKTQGLIRGGFSLGGVALGTIGLDILTDGLTSGATSSRTQNNYNSRVISDTNVSGASTASSSGTGMGIANTLNSGGQAVGGLEPRTIPINGDVTEISTGSLSGENAPITTAPPAEVTLPVE